MDTTCDLSCSWRLTLGALLQVTSQLDNAASAPQGDTCTIANGNYQVRSAALL